MTLADESTAGSPPQRASDPTTTYRDPVLAELVARRAAQLRRAQERGVKDWSPSDSYWSLQLGRRSARGSR